MWLWRLGLGINWLWIIMLTMETFPLFSKAIRCEIDSWDWSWPQRLPPLMLVMPSSSLLGVAMGIVDGQGRKNSPKGLVEKRKHERFLKRQKSFTRVTVIQCAILNALPGLVLSALEEGTTSRLPRGGFVAIIRRCSLADTEIWAERKKHFLGSCLGQRC